MSIKLSESKPPITPQQLREVEQAIGYMLPQQYKAFLLETNGGRPKPAYFNILWSGQDWALDWGKDYVGFFLSVLEDGPSNFLKY